MAASDPLAPAAGPAHRPRTGVLGATLGIVLLIVGLPVAAYIDLKGQTERSLVAQAEELGTVIRTFRTYYSTNVVGRLGTGPEATKAVHNFHDLPGTIPVPATVSLDLMTELTPEDGSLRYRFISAWPFTSRAPHEFDAFEREALARLEERPDRPIVQVSGDLVDRRVRRITPILMAPQCVSCHNSHPLSPKKDWKVGDVRGIEEIDVHRFIGKSPFAFKALLVYFACAAVGGILFIRRQRNQARVIQGVNEQLGLANGQLGLANDRLGAANAFLGTLSTKLSKYLSPQLYRSLFSGEKDAKVATERKKLTIFFSDIVDFTPATERLQPEELTSLLNEYLTEMSAIAARHGGTIDKFIGDAIVIFFGDPETKGAAQDATACLLMAVEMQRRLEALNAAWRGRGIEKPFRARMGINTGYCDVGNFGSEDRVEYTIIGAEANLAARLQTACQPGGILLSYETYALVRDVVRALPMPPMQVKGVSRTIVPYAVEGLVGEAGQREEVVSAHATGLDLFVDTGVLEGAEAARAVEALRQALVALEKRHGIDPA